MTHPPLPPSSSENPAPADGATGGWPWGKLVVVAVIALAIAGFFASGAYEKLTPEGLRAEVDLRKAQIDDHPLLAVAIFFLLYVAVTGLSVPGALILTVTAGVLFGRWLGTGLVSFASTAGATLAFLSSRYLLRDWVQRRFGRRLEPINRGVERDGAFYLLILRLVPAFPFFLINLAMGLTRMRVWTYWWVSQLGMLPATFLYVNAGAELGAIQTPRDVLSPTLLISLALLGIVPLAIRKLVQWGRRRHSGEDGADEMRP